MSVRNKQIPVRLFAGAAVAALLVLGGLSSARASGSPWEAILGGHLSSASEAQRIVSLAAGKGFSAHVQRISSNNYEAEIFNGGSTSAQADAVCARARKAGGLPGCS